MRRVRVGTFLGRSLVSEYRKVAWSTRIAVPVKRLLRARRAQVLTGLRHPQYGLTAAMPPVDPFGQTTWADDLANSLDPHADNVYAEISDKGYELFAPADSRGVLSRVDMSDHMDRMVGRMVGLGPDTASAVGATLTQGFAAGESYADLASRVGDVFDVSDSRAEMIARTEVTTAVEGVNADYAGALADSGLPMVKAWLDSEDACPECEDNAAQDPIDVSDSFDSGDDEPPAHPNCRCSLAYDTEGGPVAEDLTDNPGPWPQGEETA